MLYIPAVNTSCNVVEEGGGVVLLVTSFISNLLINSLDGWLTSLFLSFNLSCNTLFISLIFSLVSPPAVWTVVLTYSSKAVLLPMPFVGTVILNKSSTNVSIELDGIFDLNLKTGSPVFGSASPLFAVNLIPLAHFSFLIRHTVGSTDNWRGWAKANKYPDPIVESTEPVKLASFTDNSTQGLPAFLSLNKT